MHRNPYNDPEPYSIFPENVQAPISSNIDDKALHEVTEYCPFSEA